MKAKIVGFQYGRLSELVCSPWHEDGRRYPRLRNNSEHGEHTEGIEYFGQRRRDRKEVEKRATAARS